MYIALGYEPKQRAIAASDCVSVCDSNDTVTQSTDTDKRKPSQSKKKSMGSNKLRKRPTNRLKQRVR